MSDIREILSKLVDDHFYGTLEIKLEGGRIVLVRKTETIKPSENNYRDSRKVIVNADREQ